MIAAVPIATIAPGTRALGPRYANMPVICIGPVCIPIYPLVILVLKPIWDILPESVSAAASREAEQPATMTPAEQPDL